MLNTAELKLLHSDLSDFPMIKAASAALKNCGKCGHGNVNARTLLRLAVTKYANMPRFVSHCRALFPLPVMLGGILVKEGNK